MIAEYPYGFPPSWWGKGREAAGQAARDAIALSVRVGERMRRAAGDKGNIADVRPAELFVDPVELAEAVRLIALAGHNTKKGRGK